MAKLPRNLWVHALPFVGSLEDAGKNRPFSPEPEPRVSFTGLPCKMESKPKTFTNFLETS